MKVKQMPRTPEEVVDSQLAAYNAHNIDAFMATHSATIQMLRFPSNEVFVEGADAMRSFMINVFEEERPHVDIIERMLRGNFVIANEIGRTEQGESWRTVAIYEVVDELIQRVWFVVGNDKAPG